MKKYFNRIFLFFFIFFSTQLSFSQNNQVRFEKILSQEGISQTTVNCILQDQIGFIWFGTKNGLNRYDGYSVTTFKYNPENANSISHNEVTALFQDRKGFIWIGTRGGGLCCYSPKTEYFERISIHNKLKEKYTNNTVNTITEDNRGVIWVGFDKGLFKIYSNSSNLHFLEKIINNTLTNNKINAVYEDNLKRLFVLLDNGLYYIDKDTYRLQKVNLGKFENSSVISIAQDKYSNFWLGTMESGIIRATISSNNFRNTKLIFYNTQEKYPFHITNDRIPTIVISPSQQVWFGTRGGGLYCLNKNNEEPKPYTNKIVDLESIGENIVNSLLIDRTGILWIGLESKGLNKIDLYRKQFYTFKLSNYLKNEFNEDIISSIQGNKKGKIWVGTDGGGIIAFDNKKKTPQFTDFKSYNDGGNNQQSKVIISLYSDNANNLWIGSAVNSINRLTNGKITHYSLPGWVFSIVEDKLGYIWLGTWGSGLFRLNPKTGVYNSFIHNEKDKQSISGNNILSLYKDNFDNLWIGTKGSGLNCIKANELNTIKPRFQKYLFNTENSSNFVSNDIYSIYQDNSNHLWVATGGGLNQLNVKTGKKKSYSEKDGLPSNLIYGILEDNHNNLWISSNNGLSKFSPMNNTFTNYNIYDGLQGNEFHHNAYYKDENGRMYFGGVNGFSAFYPDSIFPNPYLSNVVITNLKIFDKYVHVGDTINHRVVLSQSISLSREITLLAADKEITIEFAGLHYSNPNKNKYAYRLIGFNNNWQITDANNRTAKYTNLNQGNYVFEVKGTNNDGIWNKKVTQLYIEVKPPFWKTVWAFLFYILIILLILLVFRRYSIIAVEEKHKINLDNIERKKSEELTRMKMQFFTNVSHEIRTPLTLINAPLEDLISDISIESKVQNQLKLINQNVRRLLYLVNQLLDFEKIDSGQYKILASENDVNAFIEETIFPFYQYALKRNISFKFNKSTEIIYAWFDREKMATVLYNLLSNAFKFTQDSGEITLETKLVDSNKDNNISHKFLNIFSPVVGKSNLQIKVLDSGIGIPETKLNKIFSRFYQINEKELNKTVSGSGVGLAITKELVEIHKGKVTVTSEKGKGSCFIIQLPMGNEHLKNDEMTTADLTEIYFPLIEQDISSAKYIENNPDIILTNAKKLPVILIIEDNLDLLNYITESLNEVFEIYRALNGKDGLKKALKLNPDLIVTDVMMPEMDGIELCKILKTEIKTSHIPVIILTAKVSKNDTIVGFETGADAYISKPFNMDILKAQIRSLIDARKKLKEKFSKETILRPSDITVNSTDEFFLNKAVEIIDQNISNEFFGVKEMTLAIGMSHSVLFRKIKALTDQTVVDFIRSIRLKKAALILQKEKIPINELSIMVGFEDAKYFSKCFVRQFNMTPTEYAANYSKDNFSNSIS